MLGEFMGEASAGDNSAVDQMQLSWFRLYISRSFACAMEYCHCVD